MTQRVQISVIGTSEGDEEILRAAEAVGRGIAEAGAVLVCGGLTGVMEAASRGAAEAGGTVLAILPTLSPADANPYVTHAVATGTGHARNLAVVASGGAVIAVGGEWGTLSEIAYARKLGRPVVSIQSWPLRNRAGTDLGIVEAGDRRGGGQGGARSAVAGGERRGSAWRERRDGPAFTAVNEGSPDEAIALLSEDVRWNRPPDVPVTGTLEGAEAVRRWGTCLRRAAGELRDGAGRAARGQRRIVARR